MWTALSVPPISIREDHNVIDLDLTPLLTTRTSISTRTKKKISRDLTPSSPFFPQETGRTTPPTNRTPHNPPNKLLHTEASHLKEAASGVRINDYLPSPVGGRLLKFKEAWEGSHFMSTIFKGLTWSWKTSPPPAQTIE